MVRLITHNMLACHVREWIQFIGWIIDWQTGNCNKDNFPLVFSEVELVIRPAPENYDFLRRFLPKLDWNALVDTARSVSSFCPAWCRGDKLMSSSGTRYFRTTCQRLGQMSSSRPYIMSWWRWAPWLKAQVARSWLRRCTSKKEIWHVEDVDTSTKSQTASPTWSVFSKSTRYPELTI